MHHPVVECNHNSVQVRISSLASRLVDPNDESRRNRNGDSDEDEDAIFAELEAEIENDDDAATREKGMAILRSE